MRSSPEPPATSPALWIIPSISAAILALSASLLREASQIAPLAHELNRVCGGVLLECARLLGVVLFVVPGLVGAFSVGGLI